MSGNYLKAENVDSDGLQRYSDLNDKGQELPDPYPLEVPIPPALTLREEIQRALFAEEVRRAALEQGFDTPEECDDLDIADDPIDPLTPWEEAYEASVVREATRRASANSASVPLSEKTVEKPKADSSSDGTGGSAE